MASCASPALALDHYIQAAASEARGVQRLQAALALEPLAQLRTRAPVRQLHFDELLDDPQLES